MDDEIAFLRMLDGGPKTWSDGREMMWGAKTSFLIDGLQGRGLVTYPRMELTDKGREFLAQLKTEGGV